MKFSVNAFTSLPRDEVALPEQPSTLAHLLLRAARKYPRSGVCMVPAEGGDNVAILTHLALLEKAQHILGGLQALGQVAGAKIALLLERPLDFIPAFWACVLGGYVPCCVRVRRWAGPG